MSHSYIFIWAKIQFGNEILASAGSYLIHGYIMCGIAKNYKKVNRFKTLIILQSLVYCCVTTLTLMLNNVGLFSFVIIFVTAR